jgi:hypothetical protein
LVSYSRDFAEPAALAAALLIAVVRKIRGQVG